MVWAQQPENTGFRAFGGQAARGSTIVHGRAGTNRFMLRDAALYITKLPKAVHDAEEWQGGGPNPGGDAGRPDDVRAHRCHAGAQSARREGVRSHREKEAVGTRDE